MEKKFINVGFEFTAAAPAKGKIKSNVLTFSVFNTDQINRHYREDISKYSWINEKFESDDCGCEVPTPIIQNKKDVTRYFNEFESFAKSLNLKININEAKCALGGCHIHMNVSDMKTSLRELFVKNVGIYLTNNPQLNWGFNDVNDNWNANSLLSLPHDASPTSNTTEYIISETPKGQKIVDKYKHDKSPLRTFLDAPLDIVLYKYFAVKYNTGYETIEFRIFDMPKNLKQHLLHYNVATAIYNHCYKAAVKGQLLKLKYTNITQYKFTLKQAITNFDKEMKRLGIAKARTAEMRRNIRTRYEWNAIEPEAKYLI